MKVILQNGLRGLSGSMEDWIYQYRNGKTYLGPKHLSTKDPTQAMIAHREHFKEASVYGKRAMANPALCEFYKPIAEARGITIYTLAVADFLNEPELKPLDLSGYQGRVGDTITIRGEDDLGFADVEVTITAIDGTRIEQGKAVEEGVHTDYWIYTATKPVALGSDIFVEVVGVDHAGTKAKITENPIVGSDN